MAVEQEKHLLLNCLVEHNFNTIAISLPAIAMVDKLRRGIHQNGFAANVGVTAVNLWKVST